jgi:hypothetical protein
VRITSEEIRLRADSNIQPYTLFQSDSVIPARRDVIAAAGEVSGQRFRIGQFLRADGFDAQKLSRRPQPRLAVGQVVLAEGLAALMAPALHY